MPLLCKRLEQGSQFALKSLHLLCGRGGEMSAIFQVRFCARKWGKIGFRTWWDYVVCYNSIGKYYYIAAKRMAILCG
ncbi:hypothetical protein [Gallibacterium anatis]|uniref:hypothetical protein n=1 Tax=Gallibacterium anatis TaxID=750 RepID=UPI003006B7ED